ncbi:unnamed protein product [Urochloa humidicola]
MTLFFRHWTLSLFGKRVPLRTLLPTSSGGPSEIPLPNRPTLDHHARPVHLVFGPPVRIAASFEAKSAVRCGVLPLHDCISSPVSLQPQQTIGFGAANRPSFGEVDAHDQVTSCCL